jgi:hypothetical protein
LFNALNHWYGVYHVGRGCQAWPGFANQNRGCITS